MGTARTKAIVYALLPLLLLQFTNLVSAVDITFWSEKSCSGQGFTCFDLVERVCCFLESRVVPSVSATKGDRFKASFFKDADCRDPVSSSPGNICLFDGTWAAASWLSSDHRRRALLADDSETSEASNTCKAKTKPNSIAYSEDYKKGQWILTTNNATEMFSQMTNVAVARKVDWLKTHGAIYQSGL